MAFGLSLALTLIGLSALFLGFLLQYRAIKQYGSASAPRKPSFHPKNWRFAWAASDWFEDRRGFKIFLVGDALLFVGPILAIIGILLHKGVF
jgi:hypothetical protein